MASITIRNLEGAVKAKLSIRAAEHGRSIEEEARMILRDAVEQEDSPKNVAQAIRSRFARFGGVELDLPPREPMRGPPRFE